MLRSLTDALARTLAHELAAFDEVRDAEARAHSVAGNAMQVSIPLLAAWRARVLREERKRADFETQVEY